MNTQALRDALRPAELLWRRLVEFLPTLVVIVLIVLAGLLFSILLGRATRWFVRHSGLDALAERAAAHKVLYSLGIRRSLAVLLGRVAVLLGVLVTLFTASEAAGFTAVARGITTVVVFLPHAIVALAIVIGGVWAGSYVRQLIVHLSRRDSLLESPQLVSELAHYTIIVVAITLSASQLGIETGLITSLIEILFGALAFGLALAFALGARGTLNSIIARHYAMQLYRPGDYIRLDDEHQGIVTRHGPTTVSVRAERGDVVIPYDILLHTPVHLSRTSTSGDGLKEDLAEADSPE